VERRPDDPVGLGNTIRVSDLPGQSAVRRRRNTRARVRRGLVSGRYGAGEVDRFGWLGVGLSRCELPEGTVRPAGVVVPQVLGENLPQMVLIDDQQPVEDLPAQGTDGPFADRVAPRRQLHPIRMIGTVASGRRTRSTRWPARTSSSSPTARTGARTGSTCTTRTDSCSRCRSGGPTWRERTRSR